MLTMLRERLAALAAETPTNPLTTVIQQNPAPFENLPISEQERRRSCFHTSNQHGR